MRDLVNNAGFASDQQHEAGFTLLEFLVAFVVLALFLASILAGVSVAFRGDRQAAFLAMATVLAKSKLAAAGTDFPLRAGGTSENVENGLAWRATVHPYGGVALTQDRRVNAYWVEVTVTDPSSNGRRSMSLSAIEIRGETRR
jgi:type II secretory pathway pseudopilin PulG